MLPPNPTLQMQPAPTFVPVECDGQLTASQLRLKKGVEIVAMMLLPLKPTSHVQSLAGTFVPIESGGHGTATGGIATYDVDTLLLGVKLVKGANCRAMS